MNKTEDESVYRGDNWPGESRIRIQRVQAASSPLSGSFDIQAYGQILKGILKKFGTFVHVPIGQC